MKTIHIQEYCALPGNSQAKAAELLNVHQTAVSKMIRTGRAVFLELTDEDVFVRSFEMKELSLSKKTA